MEDENKPQMAVWEYQNTDEDFERRIVMNVTGLMRDESKTDEEKQQYLSVMDGIVKSLLSAFNMMPKTADLDNRILSDSEQLPVEEK